MNSSKPTIDVVYIARGIDWGISAVLHFFESYQKNEAGYNHNLIVAAKAWETKPQEYEELKEICKSNNAQLVDLPDDGFDFGAYWRIMQSSKGDYIFGMASSASLQVDNWLKKIVDVAKENEQYKLIGCHGSWELCPDLRLYLKSKVTSKYEKRGLMYTIEKCFLYISNIDKFIKRKLNKQKFPNYFVLTCGFLIQRELFLEFMSKVKLPKDKMDAYELEHGKNGMSNFILKKGFKICVVDKFGQMFDKEEFNLSHTYRSEIKNYMKKNKQINFYENSSPEYRKDLRESCWGGDGIEYS